MSIWSKYKTDDLPEEQRVEVIKHIVTELEQTKRSRMTSEYLWYKGLAFFFVSAAIVVASIVTYYSFQAKFESERLARQPVICPAPNPPAFNIKVSPIPAAASSAAEGARSEQGK